MKIRYVEEFFFHKIGNCFLEDVRYQHAYFDIDTKFENWEFCVILTKIEIYDCTTSFENAKKCAFLRGVWSVLEMPGALANLRSFQGFGFKHQFSHDIILFKATQFFNF